eukprot:Gb_22956 [translate_table: standard]
MEKANPEQKAPKTKEGRSSENSIKPTEDNKPKYSRNEDQLWTSQRMVGQERKECLPGTRKHSEGPTLADGTPRRQDAEEPNTATKGTRNQRNLPAKLMPIVAIAQRRQRGHRRRTSPRRGQMLCRKATPEPLSSEKPNRVESLCRMPFLHQFLMLIRTMRVAVVGAGVSGLVAAYTLARAGVHVVLYEKEDYLGGHAHTLCVDGIDIDLGFMVCNRVTYSNTMAFFEELGVDLELSDMSFSVSLDNGKGCEWGSSNGLAGLFAQKSNALNPFFWRMITEIVQFKQHVIEYALFPLFSND